MNYTKNYSILFISSNGKLFPNRLSIVDPVETKFKYQTPTIVTGKKGSAPGELDTPYGVALDEATNQIFVANQRNNRVEIFSETGEYLYQLGVGQLSEPCGIAIHGDNVYVSCWGDHTVSKFSLTEMCRIRRIGGRGPINGQLLSSRQLTTDSNGRVFIADEGNDRIRTHDPDLNHLYDIWLQSMLGPYDVKVSRDYVLCPYNILCLHVLTLEGDTLHSLITCGGGMVVSYPRFFLFGSSQQLCPQRLDVSLNSCLLSRKCVRE